MAKQKKKRATLKKKRKDNRVESTLIRLLTLVGWGIAGGAVLASLWIMGRLVQGYMTRTWYGVEDYRLLVKTDQAQTNTMYVLELSVEPTLMRVIEIPQDVLVPVPGGYGEYRLGTLPRLMELEDEGEALMLETLSQALGRRIRSSVEIRTIPAEPAGIVPMVIQRLIWSSWWGRNNLFESILLVQFLMQLKASDVTRVSLDTQPVYRESVDVDGMRVRAFDLLVLDEVMERLGGNPVPQLKDISVVMENTTGVSGLAHQWARFITHEGYDVVGEVSSDEQLERTQVVFTKPELPETIAGKVLIGQWLNPEVRLEGPSDVYRSDVIVRLGKDARVY